MVRFRILSGRQAGHEAAATRFPWQVGRTPAADLSLPEEGVWDRHFEVDLDESDRFVMRLHPHALATLNGQPVQAAPLRNGDLIEAGPVKLQFWLGPTRQRGLRWREFAAWSALTLLGAAQVALVRWLSS